MTKGNGVNVPTPGLPSLATGGVDPTVGKGDPAFLMSDAPSGVIGAGVNNHDPNNAETASESRYIAWEGGCGQMSMRDDSGRNGGTSDIASMGTMNAESSGKQSMMDMTGPRNTEAGHTTPSSGSRWSDNTGGNHNASHSGSDGREYWD